MFRGVDIEPLVASSFLMSPECFDKQLTQQRQIHPHVCPFSTSTKFWQSYSKRLPILGAKIGGKIGQVTYS